jgi:hypothetical protein
MSTLESAQLIIVTSQVAIKFMNRHQDLTKNGDLLRRKIKVWGRLQNEHILPLLGLCHGYGALPGLVSPWMDNGSLMYFLYRRHITLTRYECFRLVSYFGFDRPIIHRCLAGRYCLGVAISYVFSLLKVRAQLNYSTSARYRSGSRKSN